MSTHHSNGNVIVDVRQSTMQMKALPGEIIASSNLRPREIYLGSTLMCSAITTDDELSIDSSITTQGEIDHSFPVIDENHPFADSNLEMEHCENMKMPLFAKGNNTDSFIRVPKQQHHSCSFNHLRRYTSRNSAKNGGNSNPQRAREYFGKNGDWLASLEHKECTEARHFLDSRRDSQQIQYPKKLSSEINTDKKADFLSLGNIYTGKLDFLDDIKDNVHTNTHSDVAAIDLPRARSCARDTRLPIPPPPERRPDSRCKSRLVDAGDKQHSFNSSEKLLPSDNSDEFAKAKTKHPWVPPPPPRLKPRNFYEQRRKLRADSLCVLGHEDVTIDHNDIHSPTLFEGVRINPKVCSTHQVIDFPKKILVEETDAENRRSPKDNSIFAIKKDRSRGHRRRSLILFPKRSKSHDKSSEKCRRFSMHDRASNNIDATHAIASSKNASSFRNSQNRRRKKASLESLENELMNLSFFEGESDDRVELNGDYVDDLMGISGSRRMNSSFQSEAGYAF